MRNMRCGVVVLLLVVCCSITPVSAGVSIGIGLPNISIGINLPLFPELVPVPGYPVYYAPRVGANYFFYDGMYWVYIDDYWYASYWYNGPWAIVEPFAVPLYILRIPVRYYVRPPAYFHGWRRDAPPRWGDHWGREWEQQRRGWDRGKRVTAPARAPLPVYQRQYSGDRYPRTEQQHELHRDNYRYQPRDKAVRQHYQQQREQVAPAPVRRERQEEPRLRGPAVSPQPVPAYQQQRQEQRPQPGDVQHERQTPRSQGQGYQERETRKETQGQGQGQRKDEDRGR